MYISISFSIQRLAYVASFICFSGLKLFIALISPIVPTDTMSSISMPVLSYFFDKNTTKRRLRSTSVSRASLSPAAKRANASASSSAVNGVGNASVPHK